MLRLRRLPIDAYNKSVAYLPRNSSIYRPEEFQALSKVEIRANGRRIMAVLNIINHHDILAPGEVGLSEQGFTNLGIPEGSMVDLSQAGTAGELRQCVARLMGKSGVAKQLLKIITDIAEFGIQRWNLQLSFLPQPARWSDRGFASYASHGLHRPTPAVDGRTDRRQALYGGIPGNRTSMMVRTIVAAHGLMIPQDVISGHHFAGRHSRHDGSAGKRGG